MKAKKQLNDAQKKKLIQIIAIAGGLVLIFIIVLSLTSGLRLSKEKKLEKNLISLGEQFYTEFYYDQTQVSLSDKNMANYLKTFKEMGIGVSLNTLSTYSDDVDQEKIKSFDNVNGKACDKENTMVVIYPKEPYGKKDYTIEAKLDCGFKSKK